MTATMLLAIAMSLIGPERTRTPQQPIRLSTPADAWRWMQADLQTLTPLERTTTRYLVGNFIDSSTAAKVLSGHMNGLSLESDLVPLWVVPNTNACLLRMNLLDYGPAHVKVWEKLASEDPYFHAQVEVEEVFLQEWGREENGRWVKTRDVPTKRKVRRSAVAVDEIRPAAIAAVGKKCIS